MTSDPNSQLPGLKLKYPPNAEVALMFSLTNILVHVAALVTLENRSYEEQMKVSGTHQHLDSAGTQITSMLEEMTDVKATSAAGEG